ncbi:MAG: hypothetical protein JW937_09465, partial [Candidatus Omnitrophica bacterium]|nr:hypothetical protein [Candidatus Omnitrophota bacterium]
MNRLISLWLAQIFLLTSVGIGWAAPTSGRLFKRPQRVALLQPAELSPSPVAGFESVPSAPERIEVLGNAAGLRSPLPPASELRIPAQFARRIQSFQGKTDRLVVHIQDLHTHAEAQRNSASLIQSLVENHDLALICVEGAMGYVDPSVLAACADADLRRCLSDVLLDAGEITGEEYLAFTERPSMLIWGVEDPDLYFRNGLLYQINLLLQPGIDPVLAEMEQALSALKSAYFSRALQDLDARRTAFEAGDFPLEDYLKLLNTRARETGVLVQGADSPYPNLSRLLEASAYEAELDSETLKKELQQFLQKATVVLSEASNQAFLQRLLAASVEFREGRISALDYYSRLLELRHGSAA